MHMTDKQMTGKQMTGKQSVAFVEVARFEVPDKVVGIGSTARRRNHQLLRFT